MTRTRIGALAASISLIAALTACSGDDQGDAEPAAENDQDTADQQAPAPEAPTEEGAVQGEASFTVGGESFDIEDPLIECAGGDNGFAITVAPSDESSQENFAAVLYSESGEEGAEAVAFTFDDGSNIAWLDSMDPVEVSLDGSTYTITGQAPTNREGVEIIENSFAEFEFVITCP
ncbi:lipoprotein LpqH [Gulosibacter sp. 10]|uniref:lipoprotein LpqH n=1 Tax=Gulosibacter sp. 10 TaxID=1255570 RepID=UPI001595AA9F|nr:lipoprotein LpqH [Gulosibacter sp. 10]